MEGEGTKSGTGVTIGTNGRLTWQAHPFRPAGWAAGPNAQTLAARVSRSAAGPPCVRERLQTPDGDFLDLDWGPDPSPQAPVVLILHGLEGSSARRYVRNASRALLDAGIRPAALNFRGCSGVSNHLARSYHSGETDDPARVIALLRERHPGRRIGALGFSLGGNVLLKLMGERSDGGTALLDASVAMSVPYDLDAGSAQLEAGSWGRMYTAYFLRSLRRKVRAKQALLEAAGLEVRAAIAASTIRAFDDRLTAPLHGFPDAAAYYAASSSAAFLSGIHVPTLLLHASDDPFLPARAIPRAEARANPRLHLELQPTGGHVGFLEGSPWRPRLWADEEAVRFLAAHLGATPERGSDGPGRGGAPAHAKPRAERPVEVP